MTIHKTVLLKEAVDNLKLKEGMTVVDATLGGGGHSLDILREISSTGRLISIDRDQEAIDRFEKRIEKENVNGENMILVKSNFSEVDSVLDSFKIEKVDGILADFGLSSDQLDSKERGFSFRVNAELDMRMDKSQELTAKVVVNTYDFKDLERIIRIFGDERYAKRIARGIIENRKENEIGTTNDLINIIEKVIPEKDKRKKIHFATKTFQAIRMEVNGELESIEKFLRDSVGLLRSKGRLAVISFHSGEDRVVKNIFKEYSKGCECPSNFPVCVCGKLPDVKLITRKPILPSDQEIEENLRSRSAKLRVIEKI
ncbi:16S rRNA (cytosine(1402)-N(4))-methyltransferase RsmH [Patescibacteria group bacterium]